MPRALGRLEKRKHMKFITKMVQTEFKLGTAESGRSVLEGLLANMPKRVDLW
jgi:rRNA biogenesis protein RRP5